MKIMIDIGHPAHVHFYKNTIWALEDKGHEVMVTARDKEVCVELLNLYNIPHTVLTKMGHGTISLMKEWLIRDYKLLMLARKFKPDVLTGILNPSVAHVSWLLGKKAIIFNDTEHATFAQKITYPFADVICTPSCFKKDIGKKQIRYDGYHDIAYLHPNYFTPNPAVLDEIGLTEDDTFIILRFVLWNASHDIGQSGIQNKVEMVHKLEKYGRVLITSEGKLGDDLKKYQIKVSPEKLHHLLYYASLYVGDGGTTASECAVLGTHAILISTTAKYCGIFNDLHNYGLIWTYDEENSVADFAQKLLQINDLWKEGKKKRDILINEKINVTNFMVWFLDKYPYSFNKMKQNPDCTHKFR